MDESWLVMLYTFVIVALVDGLQFCFGVIALQLIERRNYSREDVVWIITTLGIFRWVFSCVVSRIYRLCGGRWLIFTGAVLFWFGFSTSGFSDQRIVVVVLFVGVLGGTGLCLMYIPAYIALNMYYKKKIQMANGLVMSASAIGVVIFPPILHWIQEQYGIQGALLLSGTCLLSGACAFNMTVFGVLMPPLIHGKSHDSETDSLISSPFSPSDKNAKAEAAPIAKESSVPKTSLNVFLPVDLFVNWRYSAFTVLVVLVSQCINFTIYAYLPDLIVQGGHGEDRSWQPLTMLGITNTFARFMIGFSHKSQNALLVTFLLCSIFIVFLMISFPVVQNSYWLICVCSAAYGPQRPFLE